MIAPAATGVGETLALFDEHLPSAELSGLRERVLWEHLPPDPHRRLEISDAESA